ncbi:MAG: glyceraldehyde-3-phosphate dehydrogenase [Burkholderiales bacterium]|nr:glyceraldehyde-3-phosphate dehydrogenase [Burkholderiales bacterium]
MLVVAFAFVSQATGAQGVLAPLRDAEILAESGSPAAKRTGRARFFDPDDGQLDLSYFLEDPRGFLPVPVVVTEPAVGYGGGGAGLFLRPRREAGDEGWARPDISALGGMATQNGTWAAFGGDASRWLDGRLRTLAGGGAGTVNLDFYGLGTARASDDQAVRYSLQFTGVVAQANWQIAPKSPLAAGVRYVFADVEPKLRDDPAFPGLADRIRVTISAPTAILEYDTRDNLFTPTRGVYAESAYMASREALGATADFERFDQVLTGWHTLPHDVTLGARGNYAWSSDGTPFFLRPFVMLRGVPAVRYQGDQAAAVEFEARWQFHERWSLVAFGGAGRAWTRRDDLSFTQSVGSGGIGFRYELARKFGLHAGIDVAASPGTTAVYFVVGNAWFRP